MYLQHGGVVLNDPTSPRVLVFRLIVLSPVVSDGRQLNVCVTGRSDVDREIAK